MVRPCVPGHALGQGFSLIEVLVALVIASLCVTVFFQLFSSGMRLEVRARELMVEQFQAGRIFADLQRRDIRDDDFPWEGEQNGLLWQVRLSPVDVREEVMDDGFALRKDQELYRLQLLFQGGPGPETGFTRYVAFPPDFLPPDFKMRSLADP